MKLVKFYEELTNYQGTIEPTMNQEHRCSVKGLPQALKGKNILSMDHIQNHALGRTSPGSDNLARY